MSAVVTKGWALGSSLVTPNARSLRDPLGDHHTLEQFRLLRRIRRTVTFENADSLRDALRVTPRDRILVETDAPFLTPTPRRGRPNASFLVPLTVWFMTGILGISDEELCRDINANTEQAFGGAWPERV